MPTIRIDKFLSDCKICTRSEAKKLMKSGAVTCNGITVRRTDEKVDTDCDAVAVDGKIVEYEPFVYYMMNKPPGVICATEDKRQKTVCDLVQSDYPVFPVGRLDIDTEGLLLLTNDGEFAHNLVSPSKHIPKTYYAKVSGHVEALEIKAFENGFDYGEKKPSKPATLKVLGTFDTYSEVEVTISEGKYHQIKRMFATFDQHVEYLQRIAIGDVFLDCELKPGEYRKLTREEWERLKRN